MKTKKSEYVRVKSFTGLSLRSTHKLREVQRKPLRDQSGRGLRVEEGTGSYPLTRSPSPTIVVEWREVKM